MDLAIDMMHRTWMKENFMSKKNADEIELEGG
jgi:hypothetical protein